MSDDWLVIKSFYFYLVILILFSGGTCETLVDQKDFFIGQNLGIFKHNYLYFSIMI